MLIGSDLGRLWLGNTGRKDTSCMRVQHDKNACPLPFANVSGSVAEVTIAKVVGVFGGSGGSGFQTTAKTGNEMAFWVAG